MLNKNEMIWKIYEKLSTKSYIRSTDYSVNEKWICTVCWERRKTKHYCEKEYFKKKIMYWDIIYFFEKQWYDLLWTEMFEEIFNNYWDKRKSIEEQSEKLISYIYNLIEDETIKI